MSVYCTEQQIRFALPLDKQTASVDFGDLIREVSDGFDRFLGFSYGGESRTVRLDSDGTERLMLPRPGAMVAGVTSIIEDGVALAPVFYELEAQFGRYVLRLDEYGKLKGWTAGSRIITVAYWPRGVPDSLSHRCVRECVRIYRSRQMGQAKQIGTPGMSKLDYSEGFDPATVSLLDALRSEAGSGGSGWVAM